MILFINWFEGKEKLNTLLNANPHLVSWASPDCSTSFCSAKIKIVMVWTAELQSSWTQSDSPNMSCDVNLPERTKQHCCLPRHAAIAVTGQLLVRVFCSRKTALKLFGNTQPCLCYCRNRDAVGAHFSEGFRRATAEGWHYFYSRQVAHSEI